ncbi:MAG: ABC transporter ATP-binding protein [Bacillota bacterium]|nr:ABC transporter ATP-binding protein [Bacillota bacterium]
MGLVDAQPAAGRPLMQVSDLGVTFQTSRGSVRAVSGVSFEVRESEVFALVGESGCGKSTTALAVMRLVPPPGRIDSGQVVFDGVPLLDLDEDAMARVRGKQISMIFQNPLVALNPVYRSAAQIEEALLLDQIPRDRAWKLAVGVMGDVKIPDAPERALSYPHELSGGMRQRVMTGMMISRSPRLLIADEPTTALDVTIQAQVLELLMDIRRRTKMSIMIITHDFGIVAETADRIAVMYAGGIVEQGGVLEVFEQSGHPYTRLLMRALPRLTKEEGRLETIAGHVPNLVELPSGCTFHPRCPLKRDACLIERPTVREVSPGHFVTCHYPEV